jgi:hypothetical protein
MEKMATVEQVLKATKETAPIGWVVTAEYPDQIGVSHPSFTNDEFISFGDINGDFSFNDSYTKGVCGYMQNLTNAKEIAASFWKQLAYFYPELLKGE